jgi:hypothetical protein
LIFDPGNSCLELFSFCRAIIVLSAYCGFFQTALFFCVMYIRRTHTNNSSTGERYYTYRLVANQRVDGKPRQMTLLNLGRHFAVDQDLWASLCVRIEQLMSHQAELLPIELPAVVDKAAQRIAAQLIAQRAVVIQTPLADEGHSTPVESAAPLESVEAAPVDLQAVDVDSR